MKVPATDTEGEDDMTRRYREASAADPARPSDSVRAAILEQSRLEAAALKAAGLKAPGNERQWRLRAVAGLAVVAVGVAVTLQMRQPGVPGPRTAQLTQPAAMRTPSEAASEASSATAPTEAADAGVAALRGAAKPEAARQYQQAAQEIAAQDSSTQDNAAQARPAQVAPAAPAMADATSQFAQAVPPLQTDTARMAEHDATSVAAEKKAAGSDAAATGMAARDAAGSLGAAPEAAAARALPPVATLRFSGDSAEPGPQAQAQLHEVLDYLGAHGSATVMVACSYDGNGDASAGDLARRRAAAVQELLLAQGVATERVTVAVNAADAARSERVEVRVSAP